LSDPKRLLQDLDLTLKEIPDPDCTSQVFPDTILDPGKNLTVLPSQRIKIFENPSEVSNIGIAVPVLSSQTCQVFEIANFLITT